MMAKLNTVTSAVEMLRIYITQNLAYIDQNREETRAIGDIITNFRKPDGQPVYGLGDTEMMVEGTAAMFRWGQQSGEFREFDARAMAIALRGCIDNIGNWMGADPNLDVDHYAAELLDMFLHAVRKTT
jgi:hypothetical protein